MNLYKLNKTIYAAVVVAVTLWLAVAFVAITPPAKASAEKLQHFTLQEFEDRYTNEVKMNRDFLIKLDELRERCGFPLYIVSGYRSPNHPIEKIKYRAGQHTRGTAADIRALSDVYRYIILKHAIDLGFTGIGVYPTHIHLDIRETRTVLWVL